MQDHTNTDLSHFAWRLYRQLGAKYENLVFSPFSIASVFAMLAAGARGATLTELRTVLAVSGDDESWHAGLAALLRSLTTFKREGNDYQSALELQAVNDLWLQAGYRVGADFLSTLQRRYASAPAALDFATDPEAARLIINAKINGDTSGLIPELLPPGSVGADARLVLTNAMYFKAAWAEQFNEVATQDSIFHLLDGSTAMVPMMRLTSRFMLARGDGWQAIRLPYDGNELEMLVLVPDAGVYRHVSSQLDSAAMQTMPMRQQRSRIRLAIPRFDLRTTLPLIPVLQQAGLQRVFTDVAELGGIGEHLCVSAAMHEAVVRVDELGAEAAAATAAMVSVTSMPMSESEPIELTVDRPFVFAIRVAQTGLPLFIGQVLKP